MLNLLYLNYNKACGHQTWHGGDLLWEASTIKVKQPFEYMVPWGHVIKSKSTTAMFMAIKPGRVVTFNEELLSINSETFWWRSCKITWQMKYAISPLQQWLDSVVLYNEELPLLKSQNPLITWSCKITWQIKYIISLLPQDLWPLILARWWVTGKL